MKKRIAFVTNPMSVGGVERALIAMLDAIDYKKYSVVLWLKEAGGAFEQQINPNVQIRYWNTGSSKAALINQVRKGNLLYFIKSILYRLLLRSSGQKSWVVYEYYESKMQQSCDPEPYDCVIAYQGLYSGVVATSLYRLKAPVKVAWIHGEDCFDGKYAVQRMEKEYRKFDHIFCVSNSIKEKFCCKFPVTGEKTSVFYNLLNKKEIIGKADEKIPEIMKPLSLVTVGRISKPKGQVLIPKTVRMLLDSGYEVFWYLIGDGELRPQVEAEINRYSVSENVILLGTKLNPYPYIRNCDIYIQPSFTEGYCTTTMEAKILRKPIVTTDAPGMREQFVHMKNGLIAGAMTSEAIYESIKLLLDNPHFRIQFINNLSQEPCDNAQELQKLDMLLQ